MSQEPVPPPQPRPDEPRPDAPAGGQQNATTWQLTITAEAEVIPGEPKNLEE